MNILITGGASGLGKAITTILAKIPENKVYFTYNNSSTNAEKLEAEFSNCYGIKCDFCNPLEIDSFEQKISNLDIDVLVNNAYSGEPVKTYFHKIPASDFSKEFYENIIPTIRITQACIHSFRKKKSGKIITILTSFLVNTPPTGASVYVANKAYLNSLVKSWASENAKFNITSNSVSPAFMLTGFTSDVDARIVEQMEENHPLKKILTTDEVAESVLFLTNSTQQINGIDLLINSALNIKS